MFSDMTWKALGPLGQHLFTMYGALDESGIHLHSPDPLVDMFRALLSAAIQIDTIAKDTTLMQSFGKDQRRLKRMRQTLNRELAALITALLRRDGTLPHDQNCALTWP